MTDRMVEALAAWTAGMAPEHREIAAAYTEIHDMADSIHGVPPLDEIGASGALHIAKILTRFETQMDDEWRHDLIQLGGAMLNLMRANGKDADHG